MKININLKNIIKYLILFVLACILIYFSNTLNVKADSITANINSYDITFPTSITWYDYIDSSYIFKGNSTQVISISNLNDYLSFSAPSSTLSTSNGGSGATIRFNTDIISPNHSYVLYLYLIDVNSTIYSPSYSYLNSFELCNSSLSTCNNPTELLFSGRGQKSQYENYYITNLIYRFTSTGTSSSYGVQAHFSSDTQVSFVSSNPQRGFIGYKLIDVTDYSNNTIEAMIQDNQDSLNQLEDDMVILQETQEATNDKIDEQIQQDKEQHEEQMQQDKEQHEEEMEQDKQQHEEEMESQKICQYIDKSSVLIDNKFLKNDGQLDNDNSYGITNYISISKNTKIKQLEEVANFWNSNFCFYNVNKTLIQCVSNNTLQKDQILNIPSGASYIRFSIDKNKDKPQFEICTNGNQALNDSLNNSDTSGANQDANNFFNNFENNDFGLSDIITLPLTTIQSITSKSCTPLSLTLPFVNKTFELPCMNTIYSKFEPFYSIYQTITFGVISYWVCVQIYAMVKGFKDPTSDEIEVMDL